MKLSSLFLLFLFIFSGCSTTGPRTGPSIDPKSTEERIEKFGKINLGASADELTKLFGEPSSLNTEDYQNSKYKVFEYTNSKGQPVAFFTLNSESNKIVGRSIWMSPSEKDNQLSLLQKKYFSNSRFKKYIPCESHGSEEFLVDQERGTFVATDGDSVSLVSWSDPELSRLRVEQFYLKCPQLQDHKSPEIK